MMVAPTVNMVTACTEGADQGSPSLDVTDTSHSVSEDISGSDTLLKSESASVPDNIAKNDGQGKVEGALMIDPVLMNESSVIQITPGASNLDLKTKYEQMPASSLVSPPESSNDEGGSSPAAAEGPYSKSPTYSRQTSQPTNEHFQRYTPESGTVRIASHSTDPEEVVEKEVVRAPTSMTAVAQDADQESMRLIKELQAQDMGLRRRGKV